jgi:hypothetical protein
MAFRSGRRQFAWVPVVFVVVFLLVPVRAWAGPQTFNTGFRDSLFSADDPLIRDRWLGKATGAGARLVRLHASWASVAPSPPPSGVAAAQPGWPGYNWKQLDDAVRSASAHGLAIIIGASRAPFWAEGADRPSTARRGTWKPDPIAFGEFGKALARRYSGRFPDPGVPGAMLPRVRFFEAWNEPNQDYFLAPQWLGPQFYGAGWYRDMLNRFYAGVKSAQRDAKVIAPATSPYGDRPGGSRTPPVAFLRSLLCMKVGDLKNRGCPSRPHFDILSHHPINLGGGPTDHALNPMDASTPDVERLSRVLRRAEQTQRVLPREHRPVWATEIWWNTNPPLAYGVPPAKQARWVELSQYILWRQGVSAMINLPMVEPPPGKTGLSSGIFLSDGSHKPSYTAFRFPLVAHREGGGILVWGIAPGRGMVRVQREGAGGWQTIAKVRSQGAPHPFVTKLPISKGKRIVLRAQQRRNTSLPWVPSTE